MTNKTEVQPRNKMPKKNSYSAVSTHPNNQPAELTTAAHSDATEQNIKEKINKNKPRDELKYQAVTNI